MRISGILTNPSFSPALPLQQAQEDYSASRWSLQHPALQYHAFLGLSLLRKGQPSAMNTCEKASSQLFPYSVKSQIFTEQTLDSRDHVALVAAVVPRLRMLRAVVERLPRHFTPYKHVTTILDYLAWAESAEADVWLRDDIRIAWITVSFAAQGYEQPHVAATYQVLGLHPSKVYAAISERRKSILGPEFVGHESAMASLPPKKAVSSSQDEQEKAA